MALSSSRWRPAGGKSVDAKEQLEVLFKQRVRLDVASHKLQVRLSRCGLGETEVIELARHLDAILTQSSEAGGDDHPAVRAGLELDGNAVSDTALEALFDVCERHHVAFKVIKLYRNILTDRGGDRIAALIKRQTSPIEELHLSHNKMTDLSLVSICLALQESQVYPRRDSDGSAVPCWVRLEHNAAAHPVEVVELLCKEVGFRVCFAEDRRVCGSLSCTCGNKRRAPKVHLFALHTQHDKRPKEAWQAAGGAVAADAWERILTWKQRTTAPKAVKQGTVAPAQPQPKPVAQPVSPPVQESRWRPKAPHAEPQDGAQQQKQKVPKEEKKHQKQEEQRLHEKQEPEQQNATAEEAEPATECHKVCASSPDKANEPSYRRSLLLSLRDAAIHDTTKVDQDEIVIDLKAQRLPPTSTREPEVEPEAGDSRPASQQRASQRTSARQAKNDAVNDTEEQGPRSRGRLPASPQRRSRRSAAAPAPPVANAAAAHTAAAAACGAVPPFPQPPLPLPPPEAFGLRTGLRPPLPLMANNPLDSMWLHAPPLLPVAPMWGPCPSPMMYPGAMHTGPCGGRLRPPAPAPTAYPPPMCRAPGAGARHDERWPPAPAMRQLAPGIWGQPSTVRPPSSTGPAPHSAQPPGEWKPAACSGQGAAQARQADCMAEAKSERKAAAVPPPPPLEKIASTAQAAVVGAISRHRMDAVATARATTAATAANTTRTTMTAPRSPLLAAQAEELSTALKAVQSSSDSEVAETSPKSSKQGRNKIARGAPDRVAVDKERVPRTPPPSPLESDGPDADYTQRCAQARSMAAGAAVARC